MFDLFKTKPKTSSDFADFIRDASSAKKKKLYGEVIRGASVRQNEVLRTARARARKAAG